MVSKQSGKNSPRASFAPKEISKDKTSSGLLRPSVLFLGLAVGLTAAIAIWLGFAETSEDIRLEITDVSVRSDGNVALTGARYRGRTVSGKLFEIVAASASEQNSNPGNVDLRKPEAKIYSDDGVLAITSHEGDYSQTAGKVELRGDVVVNDTTRDMVMRTQSLRADFSSGNMETNNPVDVTGPNSHVVANGMQVFGHGDLIVFNGKPKMTLQNVSVFE